MSGRSLCTSIKLSATMAGESRCLSTILHNVIKEMTKQIA